MSDIMSINTENNNFHPETSRRSGQQARITILGGTGDYGRALSLRFQEAGLQFSIGSRIKESNIKHDVVYLPYDDAVDASDVVFLTIPPHAYGGVVGPLVKKLVGKTVVDVSNLEDKDDDSNALRLQSLIPRSHVVKALNTVSAYTLENGSYGTSRDTFVCGDNSDGKSKVMQILREIGLSPIDSGSLRSAVMVEKLPFRFFPLWKRALRITIATLLPIWFYTYLRFFWYQSKDIIHKNREDLALCYPNRIIAWTMYWVLCLTYLPGVLAGFIQIYRGTKYSRFPCWLDNWMKCRKQLGLIALFLACLHAVMSCVLIGAGELEETVQKQLIPIPDKKEIVIFQHLAINQQASMLFGVLSLALMGIVGLTSLPSVSAQMSWMEWDFVQRCIGFTSLTFGFIHVIVYMYVLWDPNYKYGWKSWQRNSKGNFPPESFIVPLFPLAVIILKFVLLLPGISCHLNRIRKGKIGNKYKLLKEKPLV